MPIKDRGSEEKSFSPPIDIFSVISYNIWVCFKMIINERRRL